jgi:hypothetical protein
MGTPGISREISREIIIKVLTFLCIKVEREALVSVFHGFDPRAVSFIVLLLGSVGLHGVLRIDVVLIMVMVHCIRKTWFIGTPVFKAALKRLFSFVYKNAAPEISINLSKPEMECYF